MKNFRIVIFTVIGLLMLWFLIGFAGAWIATRNHHEEFEDITLLSERKVEPVNFLISKKINVSAWFVDEDSRGKAVIILAGIGGNRQSSISRAEFYLKQGYAVLMPDLRATGKSGGNTITFGWHETDDLIASYNFLRNKGFRKIGVHGCSLGAATILYSLDKKPDYEFIVLESCYDNLETAFHNRVKKLHLPDFVYAPLRFWIEKIADIKIKELAPEEYIKKCKVPMLIIAGDSEVQVKKEETLKLYENCHAPYKELHFIKAGKHEDFMVRYRSELEKLLEFFFKKCN